MFKNIVSFKTLLWITSVILAVCSAAFSIFGLSKLFAGAALSVIVMASTLEFAKLITVTFLHNYYSNIKRGMKIYLISASAVLMIITSLGVYGFLTNAYQLALKTYSENELNTQFIEKNKEFLTKEIGYLEKQQQELSQRLQSYDKIRFNQESSVLNNNLKSNIQRNIKSTSKTTDDIAKKIDDISVKKNKLSDSLMTLEKQTLTIDLENNQTELGPLIYISKITGYQMDYIVNIFVLIITLVFDPLAIALLLAANFITKLNTKENKEEMESESSTKNEESSTFSTDNFSLEKSKNLSILDPVLDTENYDNNSELSDESESNSSESISDEDKFYEKDSSPFNKHPWKVGF